MSDTKTLANWIHDARAYVVFTGAGVSTDSGIPDFRSPGGVWSKYQPVYYDAFLRSDAARHEYWRQKCELHPRFASARPNPSHRILAAWQRRTRLRGIVTQNIDGLHQIAGSGNVLELHGTAREAACTACGARADIEPLVQQFQQQGRVPECVCCSAPMKHATISFGQSLPTDVLDQAESWMRQADLVLALGSSLVVHPAAMLPQIAVASGARLVIVNRDPTALDSLADLTLHEPLAEVLQTTDAILQRLT